MTNVQSVPGGLANLESSWVAEAVRGLRGHPSLTCYEEYSLAKIAHSVEPFFYPPAVAAEDEEDDLGMPTQLLNHREVMFVAMLRDRFGSSPHDPVEMPAEYGEELEHEFDGKEHEEWFVGS